MDFRATYTANDCIELYPASEVARAIFPCNFWSNLCKRDQGILEFCEISSLKLPSGSSISTRDGTKCKRNAYVFDIREHNSPTTKSPRMPPDDGSSTAVGGGQSSRGRGNRGKGRGGRGGQKSARGGGKGGNRGGRADASAGVPANPAAQDVAAAARAAMAGDAEANGLVIPPAHKATQQADGDGSEAEVCFICANPVAHHSIAPCNHKTCHICGLRMRALYKTKDCAHCRVSYFV